MKFSLQDPPSWASSQYRELVSSVIKNAGTWHRLEDAQEHNRHAIRSAFATVMLQLHYDPDEEALYVRIRPEVLEDDYEGRPLH